MKDHVTPPTDPHEDPLHEHSFDGIREYDKALPNWWLWTFYGAIIFSVGYWFYIHLTGLYPSAEQRLEARMTALTQKASGGEEELALTDASLYDMSRNARIVAAGQKVYASTCASCHGANMEGGIGLNLSDNEWKHGSTPLALINVVTNGVLENGMPAWGSVLGERRVTEVVAYVLSKHPQP